MGFDLGHTISSLSKLAMRINRRIEKNNQNTNNNNKDKTFSVNVFLGKDKVIRFVPGVRNKYGVYVPIPEGLEVSFNLSPREIGRVYLKVANNALKHFGEDLDMKKAPPKYISFKGFKSQKEFNLKHFCFSSFCIDGKIKFTFLPWHKNEFCLFKDDIECVVEIDKTNNELIIGNAILEVIKKADETYPEMYILSNDLTGVDINSILYKDSIKKEIENRKVGTNKKDYELADKMRKELLDKLGVESNYLSDLFYQKIIDDRCIPIFTKYIPLFENVGISLNLIQQQFYRKNNKECSDFLEKWYLDLKKNNVLTNVIENVLDNTFVKIGDKSKITFYIDLIKENDKFSFVMVMLGKWKVKEAKPVIINRLENDKIKTLSIRALGYYKDKSIIPLIEKYLNSEYSGVRTEAKKVIEKLNNI